MPRFYGGELNTNIEDGETFDDVMSITNSSPCSSMGDFGFETLSNDDQVTIVDILENLTSEYENGEDE